MSVDVCEVCEGYSDDEGWVWGPNCGPELSPQHDQGEVSDSGCGCWICPRCKVVTLPASQVERTRAVLEEAEALLDEALGHLRRETSSHGVILPDGELGDCDCDGCRFLDRSEVKKRLAAQKGGGAG